METKYNIDQAVHILFEEQTRLVPEKIAVVDEQREISYKELDNKANQLANYILARDIHSEPIIGVCLERNVDIAIAVLAILKAGTAFMPLDPNAPVQRLQSIIANSGTNLILGHSKYKEKFLQYKGQLVLLDSEVKKIHSCNTGNPDCSVNGNKLCYVLHTSGTTGKPKGVIMEHRTLTNLIFWHKDFLKDNEVKTLGYASFNFDVSIQELFSTLCSGGTYYIASEKLKLSPSRLAKYIRENGIERIFMPFTPLQYFIKTVLEEGLVMDSLKSIITAGETLLITQSFKDFFCKHLQCHLRNQYGPTETHVATDYLLEGPPGNWPEKPSIGTPIYNTKVYILNEKLQPVDNEQEGEVYIGGVCTARGYLNQTELTEEKFLPDPFSDVDNAKMYKTGDLAKASANGSIQFIGRRDTQVKIRGFRIELAEVETTIMQHPGIKLAAANVFDIEPQEKQLVAYLVHNKNHGPGIFELRSFLGSRLPDYMIPHAFVVLNELPLNENGKLDRKSLPRPGKPVSESQYVPPKNNLEKEMVLIGQQILKVKKMGTMDNFFAMGGDSLLAAQLIDKIEKKYFVDIALATIYEKPTIVELATIINKKIKERKQQEQTQLESLLDQIENMSDEEIKSVLNEKR